MDYSRSSRHSRFFATPFAGIISGLGIICGPIRGSFVVLGSFAVQFGDHLWYWDHLRSNLGIICGTGIICGPGSFAGPYIQPERLTSSSPNILEKLFSIRPRICTDIWTRFAPKLSHKEIRAFWQGGRGHKEMTNYISPLASSQVDEA